jgi:hypothetical protein
MKKILGRPIRLADVLLAMCQKTQMIRPFLDVDGMMYEVDYAGFTLTIGKYLCQWNLRADDLTAQSDECIDFIHSLLSA